MAHSALDPSSSSSASVATPISWSLTFDEVMAEPPAVAATAAREVSISTPTPSGPTEAEKKEHVCILASVRFLVKALQRTVPPDPLPANGRINTRSQYPYGRYYIPLLRNKLWKLQRLLTDREYLDLRTLVLDPAGRSSSETYYTMGWGLVTDAIVNLIKARKKNHLTVLVLHIAFSLPLGTGGKKYNALGSSRYPC